MRVISILSKEKTSTNLIAPYQAFLSKKNFMAYIEKYGNYFFKGTDKDLLEIKEEVFSGCNFIENVERLGYNKKKNCFVLANGIVKAGQFFAPDPLGIVEGLFLPTSVVSEVKNYNLEDQKNYAFKNLSTLDLNSYISFLKAVYEEYAVMIGVSFMIASSCFDYISKTLGFFPFLNLSGQPGSGKTTFARKLLAIYSTNPEVLMLSNVSATGFMRKLEQACNIPVILDEYKNSLHTSKQEAIKNIYDIIGKTVGVKSNDSSTKQSKILSPIVLSGQEAPTGNEALLKRVVSLNFAPIKHDSNRAETYHLLENEVEKGLGNVLIEILNMREFLVDKFQLEYYSTIEKLLEKIKEYAIMDKKNLDPDTRLIKNYAILLSCLNLAVKYADVKIIKGESIESMQDHILNLAVMKGISVQTLKEKTYDEVMVFWQIVESLISKGSIINDKDYEVNKSDNEFIITARVLEEYQKYGREINGKPVTDREAIIQYFSNQDYFRSYTRKYIGEGENRTQKRCYVFCLSELNNQGFDF